MPSFMSISAGVQELFRENAGAGVISPLGRQTVAHLHIIIIFVSNVSSPHTTKNARKNING